MKKYFIITTLFIIVNTIMLQAQEKKLWDGKKCAVVLTYDDGLNVHLDNAIPLLDSLDLKGTFYIPGNSIPFANRLDEWREAAKNGHELGNHTLFHPCKGDLPGRGWVSENHDLSNYNLQQIIDEIQLANTLLKAVDGKDKRTLAYTCGELEIDNIFFYDKLKDDFEAARGVYSAMDKAEDVNMDNVNSFMINGESGSQLIELVKKAEESNSLLVFLFHGVGGEHNLNVSLPAHTELVHYLKDNEDEIWNGTLLEAALQVYDFQKKLIQNRD